MINRLRMNTKNNINSKWNVWNWLSLFIVFGTFFFVRISSCVTNNKLISCSIETDAVIYKRLNRGSKMPEVWYEFIVSGVRYTNTESLSQGNVYFVGDSIPIRYYCDDPNVCKYIRNK